MRISRTLASERYPKANMQYLTGVVIVIVILAVAAFVARRRRAALERASGALGFSNVEVDAENLRGELRGLRVHAQHFPGGQANPPQMAIEVSFSPCTLLLELRRQTTSEEKNVRAGRALDLGTGDAEFDAAWIVEGAPTPKVVELLANADLRARLLGFSVYQEACVTVEDGVVRLFRVGSDFSGLSFEDAHVRLAIDLAEAAATASKTPSPEDVAATEAYRTTARAEPSGAERIRELKFLRADRRVREGRPRLVVGSSVLPALTVYSMITVAGRHAPGLATHATVLFAFVGPLQVVATVFSLIFLRNVRRTAPGLALDRPSLIVLALGWLVILAATGWGLLVS